MYMTEIIKKSTASITAIPTKIKNPLYMRTLSFILNAPPLKIILFLFPNFKEQTHYTMGHAFFQSLASLRSFRRSSLSSPSVM
jgi:hypothetical protein